MAGDAQGNCTKILPRAALVANPRTAAFDYFLQSAKAVAPSLAINLPVPTPVDDAADIERAIKTFAREPNGGLVLPPDTSTVAVHRNLIIALAAQHRLPAVYAIRVFVVAGGLMYYGTDFVDLSGRGHPLSTASCAVQNPLTFRCRRRRSSKLSSTAKRRRHLA